MINNGMGLADVMTYLDHQSAEFQAGDTPDGQLCSGDFS